ncbi:MAG: starch-binding protein, partial [Clostridia bacterium]|nr:starch-binding protein [Clostridia bacterium]
YLACYGDHVEENRVPVPGTALDHSYFVEEWIWTAEHTAAAKLFCSACSHEETVNADVTSAVTTEPTETTPGVRTYTAAVTINGEPFTNETTETIPMLLPDYPIIVGAHSLTLDGDIGVNFYAYIPDATEDAYAAFTVDGKTVEAPIDLNELIVMDELPYFKFTCNVAAPQIDTLISGVIHDGESRSAPFVYSVQTYLTEMQEDPAYSTNEPLMALAGALANYGDCANALFAYNPDFIAHPLAANAAAEMENVTSAALAPYEAWTAGGDSGVTYVGSSLVLQSETAIRHYFTLSEDATLTDYVFLLGEGANAVELTPQASGSSYYVEIPNIPSAELGDLQTVSVYSPAIGYTLDTWHYAALSYAQKALVKYEANDPSVSDALAETVKALAVYYDAASAYFPAQGPEDDPEEETNSFLLTDNFGWGSAYVYAMDADGNSLTGEWPGTTMAETRVNEYGETQFRCYIPADTVSVIVSNGNGARTEAITDFESYTGYWMDGSRNDRGEYLVTGWND